MQNRWSYYHKTEPLIDKNWTLNTLHQASPLMGSNGIFIGIDGALYIAQAMGGQISRIDINTSELSVAVPQGIGMTGCDDATMAANGTFYTTEPGVGFVGKVRDGIHSHLPWELPDVNGIAMDLDRKRLFVNEFREGGRLMELDPEGKREPDVLLDGLSYGNAFDMGPDGQLYFPQVGRGEVWCYNLGKRSAKLLAEGFDTNVAVKSLSDGNLVVLNSGNGRIELVSPDGKKRELLIEVEPGMDNIAITEDDRIFISHYVSGAISEITHGRRRVLSPPALLGPFGVAYEPQQQQAYLADGLSVVTLTTNQSQVTVERPWYYGGPHHILPMALCFRGEELWCRCLRGMIYKGEKADGHSAEVMVENALDLMDICNSNGKILALMGSTGEIFNVEAMSEGPIYEGLGKANAMAVDTDNNLYVSLDEGNIAVLNKDGLQDKITGFSRPQGIAVNNDILMVADIAKRQLIAVQLGSGERTVVAENIPIGSPTDFEPMGYRASLSCDSNRGFYVGCNGDGSLLHLKPGGPLL